MGRQHNSQETKELLIESGIKCFLAKGYSKTTLEDIAQGAGLTRGAFYWNFKTKKEILHEVELRYEDYYMDLYRNYKKFDSAEKTLKELLRTALERKRQTNPYFIIIRYKVEASTEMEDLITRQARMDEKEIEVFSTEIRRGIETGEFRNDLNPEKEGLLILTTLLGVDNYYSVHSNVNPKVGLSEENICLLVDHLIDALKK